MAPPRSPYKGVPSSIFGIGRSRWSVDKAREFLICFCQGYVTRERKPALLKRVALLEVRVSHIETTEIQKWLISRGGPSLRDRLVAVRRRIKYERVQEDEVAWEDEPAEDEELFCQEQKECSVCMEPQWAKEFPAKNLEASCNQPSVCSSCVTEHVSAQISDIAWDQITCPECPQALSFEAVKEWASESAFEKYQQKALIAAFRDMPDFTMCLGPGCESGQIHVGGDDNPIMTCTTCLFKTCFTHKMPWHTGKTCSEYDELQKERMEQEAASEKLIADTAKICPNPSCGYTITKTIGCDHMTCNQCGFEFCYICCVSYVDIGKRGNEAHQPFCRWHTGNIRAHLMRANRWEIDGDEFNILELTISDVSSDEEEDEDDVEFLQPLRYHHHHRVSRRT